MRLMFFLLMFVSSVGFANTQIDEFVTQYHQKHGGDIQALKALMSQAQYQQKIIDAISRPAEGKPWHEYRNIFVTEKRTLAGVSFWKEHQETLDKASATYGVPVEIIVAIIGVETYYGKLAGSWSPLDALYTLGFFYKPRMQFFSGELEELITLVKEENLDLNTMKSSYAGALGYGQFIPSSYRNYAVDFDNDGKRDLLTNPVDAIGSVANYFAKHGWKTGDPAISPTIITTSTPNIWVEKGIKPHSSVATFNKNGIFALSDIDTNQQAALIQYDYPEHSEYWLAFNNFYVITRYNRSPLYARSVLELSKAIKQAFGSQ